ncbi:MAG: NYN domain-containing protein, partial [Bacteroidales bacterium]|nr:NYN domain-containing protein [Bacteroidales bacterium]
VHRQKCPAALLLHGIKPLKTQKVRTPSRPNRLWKALYEGLRRSGRLRSSFSDLTEDDVYLEIHQKGIDMKIGVDIATLSLKRFVDKIVLFSGDSDFVPAAKLARREGMDFVLDPMNANVEPQLFEHVDGMQSVRPFSPRPENHSTKKTKRSVKSDKINTKS